MALQLEARGWLLTPAQRCPLVRAAFLQVLALLPTSFSPGFTQSIHDTISAELDSLPPGGKPGCAELQVPLPAGKIMAFLAASPGVGGGDPPSGGTHPTGGRVLEGGSWFSSRWAWPSSTKPWPTSRAARQPGWRTVSGLALSAHFSSSRILMSNLPS